MVTLDFNTKERLSTADQTRVKKLAEDHGVSPGDLIEAALKHVLFSQSPLDMAKPKAKAAKR